MAGGSDRESERIGAAVAAAAATVDAPDALRERLASPAGPPPRRRLRTLAPATLGVGVALGIAVGLLAAPDDDRPPTVATAVGVALQAPNAPRPRADRRDERFVLARVGAVRFPNYGYDSGWRVSGVRRDELAGRRALTVVYRGWGDRIGYTVVDGAPLAHPANARRVSRAGRRFAVLRREGALVVTWRQGGHTCVLASRSAPLDTLLALATWS